MAELNRGDGIFRVSLPVPLPGAFDYLAPVHGPLPTSGQRVLVPFGRRRLVGLVTGAARRSELPKERLQAITRVLDGGGDAVPAELLTLLQWCARYYKHPLGEVLFSALPPAFRKPDAALPPPPVRLALTAAGRARLDEPPGRAKAQHRLLDAIDGGHAEPGTALAAANTARATLTTVIGHGWVEERPASVPTIEPADGPVLTTEQAAVLDAIVAEPPGFACHLVDGVTGSGKTEIYLRLVRDILEAGRQVLVLVPEIGLTPQLLRRFRERLGIDPVAYHSALPDGERMAAWAAAARGHAPLLIGTRSALFLPLASPGLLVMDEAHDPSFKQQDGFRYSARDVAVKRAHGLGVPIVMGSATPSLETLYNVDAGRFRRHRMSTRATGAPDPEFRVVDLRAQRTDAGLSRQALDGIGRTLERGEQVLVFLNRRGYAPVLLCHECGWHGRCTRCDANLTWHRGGAVLVCHHCEARLREPSVCPECRADALQGAGEGTERLEQALQRRFPDTPIHRVDRDAVRRRGDLERVIEQVREGDPCLLVGTQMLAKGHHFPRVTLVVIVNLDQALYSADYRALERMGQVMVQVSGRAGRAADPGTVVLQTHHPDHPALATLVRDGYAAFAQAQLHERRLAGLPPFSHQATLRADAQGADAVRAFLDEARKAWVGDAVMVHGPFPAMMEKRAGRIRWYLLLQSNDRAPLQSGLDRWVEAVRSLPSARRVRWSVDVDPQEF